MVPTLTKSKGNISVEEFSKVMKQTDKNITDAEVAKIIGEVDEDGDGTINFDGIIYPLPIPNPSN